MSGDRHRRIFSVRGRLQRRSALLALVKLCHPGHEHRNLPRALEEFDLNS